MKSLIPWKWGQKNTAPAQQDDWFGRLWDNPMNDFFSLTKEGSFSGIPSIDVSENKKEVTVKAEIPGMSEKDIDLTWQNGVLTIRGEKKDEKEDTGKNRYFRECHYGSFCRSVSLGKNMEWEKAKAKYKNGILTVSVPKNQEAQKSIEIKVE